MKQLRNQVALATNAVNTSATIIAVMFLVFIINSMLLGGRLNALGVIPRKLIGLPGILFSPLLHYNLAHLIANSVSLFILLVVLYADRAYRADEALLFIWLLSGVGTWLIGRQMVRGHLTPHIGASSVIYGLVVYLIAAAWMLRSWRSVIVGAIVLLFYGGIYHGMLPQVGLISWEGHLSGAIAGFIVARKLHG